MVVHWSKVPHLSFQGNSSRKAIWCSKINLRWWFHQTVKRIRKGFTNQWWHHLHNSSSRICKIWVSSPSAHHFIFSNSQSLTRVQKDSLSRILEIIRLVLLTQNLSNNNKNHRPVRIKIWTQWKQIKCKTRLIKQAKKILRARYRSQRSAQRLQRQHLKIFHWQSSSSNSTCNSHNHNKLSKWISHWHYSRHRLPTLLLPLRVMAI